MPCQRQTGFWRSLPWSCSTFQWPEWRCRSPWVESLLHSSKALRAMLLRLVACRSLVFPTVCIQVHMCSICWPLWAPSCAVLQSKSKSNPWFSWDEVQTEVEALHGTSAGRIYTATASSIPTYLAPTDWTMKHGESRHVLHTFPVDNEAVEAGWYPSPLETFVSEFHSRKIVGVVL